MAFLRTKALPDKQHYKEIKIIRRGQYYNSGLKKNQQEKLICQRGSTEDDQAKETVI